MQEQSGFKNALSHVVVPAALEEGVSVMRVKVNGSMRQSYLTLSADRFTLYITSTKVVAGSWSGKSKSSGSIFSFRSNSSSASTSARSSGSTTNQSADSASEVQEHSIDIGAIDRIQRGQTTHKFELAK
jgi:hypothetical protein